MSKRQVAAALMGGLCLWTCACLSARATGFVADCPAALAQKSVKFVDPATPWQQFVPEGGPVAPVMLELDAMNLTNGPPARMAVLKPDTTAGNRDTWRALDKVQWDDGLWVACGYGPGGFVLLGRRIPAGVKQCTATQNRGKPATLRCE